MHMPSSDTSTSVDSSNVIVTKPGDVYRQGSHGHGSGIHPVVIVSSDSEEDSDNDVVIVSVCPPTQSDNGNCIVEPYQPPSDASCRVSPDRMLDIGSTSDICNVSVVDANRDLDLPFAAAYNPSTDQTGTFLLHGVENPGAWIMSGESKSSVKQPDVSSVQDSCCADSSVLNYDYKVPLSMPSAASVHPQSTFSNDSVQFNTVQPQTGSILSDVGAAKVSTDIYMISVLPTCSEIRALTDSLSTMVGPVGSIFDGKSPTNSSFVSSQTGVRRPRDDPNLSLVTVNSLMSPDTASDDRVNSCCQTAAVSSNVANSIVDTTLSDTANGLLKQMSYQDNKVSKTLNHVPEIAQDSRNNNVNATSHCCITPKSSTYVPTSCGSFALLTKRKSELWTSVSDVKFPRLPMAVSERATIRNSNSHVCEQPRSSVETCCCCTKIVSSQQLTHCLVGHPCCGTCLQKCVKSILSSSDKVELFCSRPDCDAVYLTTELRNSLPDMIVEILEEKLNQNNRETNRLTPCHGSDVTVSARCADELSEFPKNWQPMDHNERYRKVSVAPGSEEYKWVSSAFHQSMSWPRAQIQQIHRIQNQTLWQFFVVKRRQMQRESENQPVPEKHLFHGTGKSVIDAICRTNFDWRVCGSHGTLYGKGSYFATEAAYSHRYTGVRTVPLFPQLFRDPSLSSSESASSFCSQTEHTMFLARVLVGRSAVGHSDYRKPPPLDHADPFGPCFDSCVDRNIDPLIYVIFNNAQCYPEYLIDYTNDSI